MTPLHSVVLWDGWLVEKRDRTHSVGGEHETVQLEVSLDADHSAAFLCHDREEVRTWVVSNDLVLDSVLKQHRFLICIIHTDAVVI